MTRSHLQPGAVGWRLFGITFCVWFMLFLSGAAQAQTANTSSLPQRKLLGAASDSAPPPSIPSQTGRLRIGMIGLDTSHVPAFTKLFNETNAAAEWSNLHIVAGYPGGTDLPLSNSRVRGFTDQLRSMGVAIVSTIPELLSQVDGVLLESVDGRIHLSEAAQVIKAGKPLFIDKPIAGSLPETLAILTLAERHRVPCFSSSSLRFIDEVTQLKTNATLGKIVGAVTWGSCNYQEGIPDMFFYGIHGIEPLFVLMGTGCQSVTRTQTQDTDVITGVWRDGRLGTYRGIRTHKAFFGAVAFGTQDIQVRLKDSGYVNLCREIARFFSTRKPPVTAQETLEIFTFMEAADESKRQGGVPVTLASVLEKAEKQVPALLSQHGP